MQLIYNILTFTVLASAFPSSPAKQKTSHPQRLGRDGALMAAGQCQIGQHYCFSAIVDDLSMSSLTPISSFYTALLFPHPHVSTH